MKGCERCGAQALAMETMCPVCGIGLAAPAQADGRPAPHIPVRRHGQVPRPPLDIVAAPGERATVSLVALGLGALGAALIAGGLGYWLW